MLFFFGLFQVLELYQHARYLLEQERLKNFPSEKKIPKFIFSLVTGFPPKPLLVALQTVEEAKLRGSSVYVLLH